jgi:tetratricopeptide (TPR) repeat protein
MPARFDVFLSHATADKPLVEELARRLTRENLKPWLDKWNLIPGTPWQPEIEAVLADCTACAVFIGQGGFGPWHHEEMRLAVGRRVEDREHAFRVIPVLLPGVDRPERSKLPGFLKANTWVEFRDSLDDPEAFYGLVCGIRGVVPDRGAGVAVFEGKTPYRGLELFDVDHAPLFFGREALTEWLLDALKRKPSGAENRFLSVVGASGSGKSSVARAGLLAALKNGKLDSSEAWPQAICRPGAEPFFNLAKALTGLAQESVSAVVFDRLQGRKDGERSLHVAVGLVLGEPPRAERLVLLVDQFEEIFTLCNDEAERRDFIANLLHAATVAGGRAIVVLTMRADFYHRCAAHNDLAAALSDHQVLIGPMTEDELRRAIERPARLAGLEPEPGLVELLLDDIRGRVGALPLLQFALQEVWRRREDYRLTVHSYREIGQLEGALQRKADAVYGSFTPEQQELCRRVFLRLVHPGEGSEDTRRRATLRELLPNDPAQAAAVQSIINRLADHESRLLTTERRATVAGEATVEVAHEALIRGWPQLRKWIEADREGLKLHRRLSEAAMEWSSHDRESSFLYSGIPLAQAREWVKTNPDSLNTVEKDFLDASTRRRRMAKVARVGAVVTLVGLAFVGWEWLRMEQQAQFAHLSTETSDDVQEARRLSLQAKWGEAITVLQGTEKRLGTGASSAQLRTQVERDLTNYKAKLEEHESQGRDSVMVTAIEEAHMAAADNSKPGEQTTGVDLKASIPGYRRAFRGGGIDVETLRPERVIGLILARPHTVREILAAALDDWARLVDGAEQQRLSDIARAADPDQYRCAIRDACLSHDLDALRKLARDPEVTKLPAFTLNRLGESLFEEGDEKESLAFLRRAQALHPRDFWISENLAAHLCWVSPPQRDEAIRYATAAVALRPESPSVHRRLAVALILRGRTNDARIAIEEALRLDPKDAFAYSTQAWIWAAEKHSEKAIAEYDTALALSPSYSIYKGRGDTLIDMGDYARAIENFDASIRLNPQTAGSHLGRGRALAFSGRFREAIEEYDKALGLNARDPFTYNCRGLALAREKHDDRAVADFSKALELYPQFGDAFANRAEGRLRLGDEKSALEDFGLAIKYGTGNERVFYNRGSLRFRNRDFNGAISDYSKAIEINPRSTSAYHDRGRAWFATGQLDKAIEDYDKAIELSGSFATAFGNRGYVRRLKRDYDGALTDLDEAIRLNPGFAWAFGRRAEVWIAKKEFDKAIEDLNEAIRLDPSRELAWAHGERGYARKALHQYDKALADFDQAIRLNDQLADPYNQRAWLWATCPDSQYRDGKKAVDSATRACELTAWKNPTFLDTLAAACAEAGDFAGAIKWEEKAIGLPAKGEPRRTTFDSRMALFEAKKPYREEPDVDDSAGIETQAARP